MFCSVGCGWCLVLICCERNVLLAGWCWFDAREKYYWFARETASTTLIAHIHTTASIHTPTMCN